VGSGPRAEVEGQPLLPGAQHPAGWDVLAVQPGSEAGDQAGAVLLAGGKDVGRWEQPPGRGEDRTAITDAGNAGQRAGGPGVGRPEAGGAGVGGLGGESREGLGTGREVQRVRDTRRERQPHRERAIIPGLRSGLATSFP
jgi:hypothetical protein